MEKKIQRERDKEREEHTGKQMKTHMAILASEDSENSKPQFLL